MTYSEKLKNPRWQKLRLEILERDKWECQKCGEKEENLHVHHLTYEKDRDPWDYPSGNFTTLCWYCHQYETENGYSCEKEFLKAVKGLGILPSELFDVSAILYALKTEGSYKTCKDFRNFVADLSMVLDTATVNSLRRAVASWRRWIKKNKSGLSIELNPSP